MREIKFRGKSSDGLWRYGLLTFMFGQYAIVDPVDENTVWTVDEESVGQYTGFITTDNIEIYEGDPVMVTDDEGVINPLNSDTGVGIVEWLGKWGFWNISGIENSLGDIIYEYEISVIDNEIYKIVKGVK